jgi:hypothetical protein
MQFKLRASLPALSDIGDRLIGIRKGNYEQDFNPSWLKWL